MLVLLQAETSGWTVFFTYGVPTGILLVILIFCYFQLWPYIKTRIDKSDQRVEQQMNSLVENIKQSAIINDRTLHVLEEMNDGIKELLRRSPGGTRR